MFIFVVCISSELILQSVNGGNVKSESQWNKYILFIIWQWEYKYCVENSIGFVPVLLINFKDKMWEFNKYFYVSNA